MEWPQKKGDRSGLGLECDFVLELGQESEMEQNRQRLLSNSEWLQWMVVTESEVWGSANGILLKVLNFGTNLKSPISRIKLQIFHFTHGINCADLKEEKTNKNENNH